MNLELNATPQEVMRAVEALQELGRARGFSEQAVFRLALALEECASNIVEHAYRRDPARKFQVRINELGDAVNIELRDQGPEFDPTRIAHPQSDSKNNADADSRPPGGWGVLLAAHYLDEFHYRRESGENVLSLTKKMKP